MPQIFLFLAFQLPDIKDIINDLEQGSFIAHMRYLSKLISDAMAMLNRHIEYRYFFFSGMCSARCVRG